MEKKAIDYAKKENEQDEKELAKEEDEYTKEMVAKSEKYLNDPEEAAEYMDKMEKVSGKKSKSLKDFKKDTRKSLIKDDLLKEQETV